MQGEHLILQGPASSLPVNNVSNPNSLVLETLSGTSLQPTGQPRPPSAFASSDGPSFLLLDVRLTEDYDACRIAGGTYTTPHTNPLAYLTLSQLLPTQQQF